MKVDNKFINPVIANLASFKREVQETSHLSQTIIQEQNNVIMNLNEQVKIIGQRCMDLERYINVVNHDLEQNAIKVVKLHILATRTLYFGIGSTVLSIAYAIWRFLA